MRLDHNTRAFERHRLNHVRVQCALRQPLGVFDLLGFTLKNFDEHTTNDLTLALGVFNTFESLVN